MSAAYRQASGNEERTFVVATSAAERSSHRCYAIAGWDQSKRPQVRARKGRGYTPSFNQIAPQSGSENYFYLAAAAMDGQRTVTGQPQGFSEPGYVSGRNSGGDASLAWSYKLADSAQTVNPSPGYRFSAGDYWITQAIAVSLGQGGIAQNNDAPLDNVAQDNTTSSGGGNTGGNASSSSGPEVSISAQSTSITAGGNVELSWNVAGANTCTASGGWQGDKPTTGSETISGVTSSQTFALTCQGPAGTTVKQLQVKALGKFQLAWQPPTKNTDGSPIQGLSAFRVYRGDSSRQYVDVADIDPNRSSVTLEAEVGTYYVAMSAVNLDGVESALSNEIVKQSR